MEGNETSTEERYAGTVLTKKAVRLIAKILASGTVLKITRAAVGTGYMQEDVDPRDLEDLNCYKMDGSIVRIEKADEESQVEIAFQVSSIGVEENFVITEAGIFAEDPDEGEILYGYLDMSDDPQYVYQSRNAISKMVEITMAIIVATTEMINVEIHPGSLVSIGDFQKFKEEIKVELDQRIKDLQSQIGDLSRLITTDKSCLVGAINEIARIIKPLIEYSFATDQDIDDIIMGIYVDDSDWATVIDIASDQVIEEIIAGTYVDEEEEDSEDMISDADIDAIIAGTYVDEQEGTETDTADKEIDKIINSAFSEQEEG